MLKVENIHAYNFEGALHGMRNPMESYDKSDSRWIYRVIADAAARPYLNTPSNYTLSFGSDSEMPSIRMELICPAKDFLVNKPEYQIGPNDLSLAQKLIAAGPEHAKFMRQIFVSMDITAPIYWWKEMDTYKVATVANSTSTMHKITSKPFSRDLFSFDEPEEWAIEYHANEVFDQVLNYLEKLRQEYLTLIKSEDKKRAKYVWRTIIQLLPESFNQTRTWTGSYWTCRSMGFQREGHKLVEWPTLLDIMKKELPYAEELIFYRGEESL